MKREIKFRAWNNSRGMWYQDTLSPDGSECSVHFFKGGIKWGVYDNFLHNRLYSGEYDELMQFTGLKDKNGKEIYEGDIVSLEKTLQGKLLSWKVEYHNYYFGVRDMDNRWRPQFTGKAFFKRCEVIGNIYENPDLIIKK